jgi:hypothetical protein
VNLYLMALAACSGDKLQQGEIPRPLGECVIASPDGNVPEGLYRNTGILRTGEYAPFDKHVEVNGIILLGWEESGDQFMLDVASAVQEILPRDAPGIDRELQESVLRAMYERKVAIPFFVGDDDIQMSDSEWAQFEALKERHSICDAIFEFGGQGQTMEVVEHILHHVTMVGLHYVFYREWGVSATSLQQSYMEEAIDGGWYNADYGGIFGGDETKRIYLQEYAYWVITTGWDIQTAYGGDGAGGEWTLQDPDDFRTAQPGMQTLFDETVPKVMAPPDVATLDGFGG